MNRLLEVCINADHQDVLADNISRAVLAGAKRFELCAAMHSDGLTPSVEATKIAAKSTNHQAELLVMIRPRAGEFKYSAEDVALMCQQIETLAACGASGAVFGALNKHNMIDVPALSKLQQSCLKFNLKSTFHRAFDCILDSKAAIKQLVDLGISRVLTSGTPWGSEQNAEQGLDHLVDIIYAADGKIEVVIGGGITHKNGPLIWQRCYQQHTNISLHAHSGVHTDGRTSAAMIEALVKGSSNIL